MWIQITAYFPILWLLHAKGHSLNGSLSSQSVKKQRMTGSDKQWMEAKIDNEISEAEENLSQNYFQGDLLMTNKQKHIIDHLIYHQPSIFHDQPYLRGLVKDIGRIWKDGVVYFSFHDNVGSKTEEMIRDAIKHWEENTCLYFKERVDEEDYILFKEKNRCASYVGRKGGKQKFYVGTRFRKCRLGNIIHEIGHAVGFFHEQTRPDRDKFIKIRWKNIAKGKRHNFVKFSSSVIDSRDVPYDYNSIMHYGSNSFARKRSRPTIVPKEYGADIGQRIALSEHDILQARLLYNCNPDKNTRN